MPLRSLRRYLPDPHKMRTHRALQPLGKSLQNPEIWHLHRRSVAGACFIGLFCSFLPVPMHMLIAGALAVATRCNLPLSVALVWFNNPLTMGPMYFFAYKVGARMLNVELVVTEVQFSFGWLADQFNQIWPPLVLGSLVCGVVSGLLAYVMLRVGWRIHVVRRWRARQRSRRDRGAPQSRPKTSAL